MVTRWFFTVLVLAVFVQRVLEGRISERNAKRILAAGGHEYARGQFLAMAVLHPAWLVGMLVEAWTCDRHASIGVAAVGLVGLLIGQTLRLAAIRTLGPRWSARIITVPGAPPVTKGIYRYLRHPNYLGVVLEMAALPLVGGAWVTALVGSAANALVLWVRISSEEAALGKDNKYADSFSDRSRFVPSSPRVPSGSPPR